MQHIFNRFNYGSKRYEELILRLISQYGGYCWPLDDKLSSTTSRDLTSTISGTVADSVTFQSTGPSICLSAVSSAYFNTGRISFSGLPDPGSTFSVSFWFNCANTSNTQTLFTHYYASNKRFDIGIASNVIKASFATSNTTRYSKSTAISTGWHHIFCSKANGNVAATVYVDGAEASGTTSVASVNVSGTYLGCRTDLTSSYVGSLSYVTVHPSTIATEHMIELYKVGLGG